MSLTDVWIIFGLGFGSGVVTVVVLFTAWMEYRID